MEAGAVETLLIADTLLTDAEVAPTLDRARSARVKVLVVREEGDAGKRLVALGRIAAILRYDWVSPTSLTGSPGSPRAAPRTGA
jgi:protein pelota